MEKWRYFKRIFEFALLWSPSKGIICSPFSDMKWETLHSQVTEEGTSCLNRLPELLLSLHPPMLAPLCRGCAPCRGVCEVQTSWLSNTWAILMANSRSPMEMPAQGSLPRAASAAVGAAVPGRTCTRLEELLWQDQAGHLGPSTQRAPLPPAPAAPALLGSCFHAGAEPQHSPAWRGSLPSALQLLPPSWPAANGAEPPQRIAWALAACPSAHDLSKKDHFSLHPSSNVTHSPYPVFSSSLLPVRH